MSSPVEGPMLPKNSYLKSLGWPLVAFVIYLLVQVVVSAPVGVAIAMKPNIDSGMWLAIALLVSSIVTSVIILLIKKFNLRGSFSSLGCTTGQALIAFFGTLFALFASDIINEFLDLPNPLEEMFKGMSSSIWGFLAIAVFGPICEEIVFRGGIMRPMLDRGINPWAAILTSAFIFGIVHGNPAQIPFAMMVGVVFGIIYFRTGSLVITSICHIINNASSVLLMNFYKGNLDELTFQNLWGLPLTLTALGLSLIFAVILLRLFWKQTES